MTTKMFLLIVKNRKTKQFRGLWSSKFCTLLCVIEHYYSTPQNIKTKETTFLKEV